MVVDWGQGPVERAILVSFSFTGLHTIIPADSFIHCVLILINQSITPPEWLVSSKSFPVISEDTPNFIELPISSDILKLYGQYFLHTHADGALLHDQEDFRRTIPITIPPPVVGDKRFPFQDFLLTVLAYSGLPGTQQGTRATNVSIQQISQLQGSGKSFRLRTMPTSSQQHC